MHNQIILPQLAWYGAQETKLTLPDEWQVEICNMAGYERPHMDPAAMETAVSRPLGMAPLREYSRGKKEVVILFDDMARVTRVAEIVPFVLAELAAAGIRDEQVRFIAACGCHGAMDRNGFVKKLGEEVLKRFPVYNHSPFHNCDYAGRTSGGTKLNINAEVLKCDLKIGIGSIVPHIMAGFGGGGKIILPGVASYGTILAFHSPRAASGGEKFNDTVTGMGVINGNPRRKDTDEAADIVGLDIKIDALVNMWGETAAIFSGKPRPAYAAALEAAGKHYLTPTARDKDIAIANTFAKANEAISGLSIAVSALSKKGGDIVLIANAQEGQATHYLMGPFGNEIGGQLQLRSRLPQHLNRLIIYNEYPELASRRYLEESDRVIMADNWTEVLRLLQENHGPGSKVAVYPNSDIQYSAG